MLKKVHFYIKTKRHPFYKNRKVVETPCKPAYTEGLNPITTLSTTDIEKVTCNCCLMGLQLIPRPPLPTHKKVVCPYCSKRRHLVSRKGREVISVHGPHKNRCLGSHLAPEEAEKRYAVISIKENREEIRRLQERIKKLRQEIKKAQDIKRQK